MNIAPNELEKFIKNLQEHQTIREGWSSYRIAVAKTPGLDKKSYGFGFEDGVYYAIAVLCGTEWVDYIQTTEE